MNFAFLGFEQPNNTFRQDRFTTTAPTNYEIHIARKELRLDILQNFLSGE